MSRLPTPGEDNGNWGEILNDFLEQSHNDDGSLKETAISTKEDVSNKSTDITTDADSDTKYPSVKATKTYTDDKIGEVNAQLAFTPFTATLEEGTIAWEGSTADDVDMARTKNFILAGAGTSLRLESVTYQFCVCLYDNTYSFIESSDWIDDEEVYTVPYDAYIKIKFERDDFTGPIDETERAVILAVMKIKARTITTFLDGVEETGYAPLSTPFESGGFYWNCTPQVNTSQIRTVGFILVGAGTILTLNSTLYTFVVYLCNKDYTYIESSEWIPGLISYTIPYDAYIRVKVEREDEAVIDETERNAIAALFRIKATPVTTFLDDEGFSTLSVPFESGDIGWWGGVDDPYPNRVRTAEFTLVGAGTVIRLKSSAYEFYVFLYDKGFKIIESIGWIDVQYCTVPYDTYIKIAVKREDSTGPIDEAERNAIAAMVEIKAMPITTFLGYQTDNALQRPAALESYWIDHIAEKIITAQLYQRYCGRNVKTCLYFTDLHYDENHEYHGALQNRLPSITKEVQARIPYHFMVNGGDTIDGDTYDASLATGYEYHMLTRDLGRIYFATGNHDDNLFGDIPFTKDQVFSIFHLEYASDVVWSGLETHDFYFDDTVHKIRVLVMDNSNTASPAWEISQGHLTWMANTVLNIGEGWSLVAYSHKILSYVLGPIPADATMAASTDQQIAMLGLLSAWQNGTTYTNETYSLDVDFSVSHGTVLGWITGHYHWDAFVILNGVPFFAVDCFKNSHDSPINNEAEDNDSYKGTINEHAYTIIHIDPDNKKLYTVRIGKGVDRIANAGLTPVAIAETHTLTSAIEGALTWTSSDENVATVEDGAVTGAAAGMAMIKAIDAAGNFEAWQVVVA